MWDDNPGTLIENILFMFNNIYHKYILSLGTQVSTGTAVRDFSV